MQIILNKVRRFNHCNLREELNPEELRIKYKVTPLNISNHLKVQHVWETLKSSEPEQFD